LYAIPWQRASKPTNADIRVVFPRTIIAQGGFNLVRVTQKKPLKDRYLLFGIGASKFRNIHEILKIEETGAESYIRGIPLLDT